MLVPAVTPVSKPEDSPIVATPGVLLVHVPPVTPSASVLVPPTHSVVVPVIGGAIFTVTIRVDVQGPFV